MPGWSTSLSAPRDSANHRTRQEGSMSFDYHFKMQIGAPRPVVFERLLRIEHISRWFCGWCRIEPKVGGTFKFGGEACIIPPEGRGWGTTIGGRGGLARFALTAQLGHWSTGGIPRGIARVDPRTGGAFSFGWSEGPNGILEWRPGRRIVLRWPRESGDLALGFDFEEKASGTAIYFSMTGFAGNEQSEIVHQRGRWSDLLVCLKNFVESGTSGFLNAYADQIRTS